MLDEVALPGPELAVPLVAVPEPITSEAEAHAPLSLGTLVLGRVSPGETVEREAVLPVEYSDAAGTTRHAQLRVKLVLKLD